MKKDKHSGFFGGLYERNETFFLISAGIFIISIFIGYFLSGILDQYLGSILEGMRKGVADGTLQLSTLSIFANNVKIALYIYAGGLVLGVYSAIYLFINGAFIGYVASKYPMGSFLIYTLPHGIFEILGIIIAGAAGFRLANGILNFLKGVIKLNSEISIQNQLKYLLESNFDEYRESFILFIIAVVLLIIAAFIEANFTTVWGNYIQGTL